MYTLRNPFAGFLDTKTNRVSDPTTDRELISEFDDHHTAGSLHWMRELANSNDTMPLIPVVLHIINTMDVVSEGDRGGCPRLQHF